MTYRICYEVSLMSRFACVIEYRLSLRAPHKPSTKWLETYLAAKNQIRGWSRLKKDAIQGLIRKYDVVSIGGKEKLIKPIVDNESDVLYYVTVDELFEVIQTAHLAVGHGGRNRIMAVLKTKYCNVTTEAVMAYLGLCSYCQTKRAEEIALNLIDIYTIFGAPAILHSDNGREFVNSIITNLNEMWGDVKIVHGKPRHSQTQGSIERANRDVEEILASWMADNKSKDWPMALKFVQFHINRALNSGIGRSPYEAMFGCTARTGLASAGIPYDEIEKLKSEEDIEELFNNSNHSNHINAVEDDLVDVGDLDNEVNLETENELRNTKDIGNYLIFILCNLAKMLAYFCKFNGCCVKELKN
ncbi:KRAB-A domain-containing protein 2-like [Myzus persicae]|uniref:KRAB-A domain-containing protein 2-like n=1 Tax=Myzus persicae TaxID=13164 RepID=UPI000B934E11|nr:KRAB-A domain-containing protein 2-like [Myzus persicae]